MPSVPLHHTEFYGRSRSVTYLRSAKPPRSECKRCGSSLHGRSKGRRQWGSKVVEVYACQCGKRQHEEVAAA